MEKLRYALAFGADAVYLGGAAFGLRAYAGNFNDAALGEAVGFAHSLGRKVYVAVNIFAHEPDFRELPQYLQRLAELRVDAVLVSDPGVLKLVRDAALALPIHLSTQANTTNSYSAAFWFGQGVKRIVLARELSLEELKAIRARVAGELEIFVHGAMCMSYSGRCMLSNYLTGRDANRGECTQPCRWGYGLVEAKRPGEIFPLEEDERGTYIFNSHDLCLLPHLPKLQQLELQSFKIEGRMKSVHYVASTVKVYREAIDLLWEEGEEAFQACLPEWYAELDKVSHRDYSAGFLFGKPGRDAHNMEISHYVRDYDFVGIAAWNRLAGARGGPARSGASAAENAARETWPNDQELPLALVEQRNNFRLGDVLEVLSPGESPWSFRVEKMWNESGGEIEVAAHAQQLVWLEAPYPLGKYSILRRAKRDRHAR